jgi:hypothetical protein
MMSSLDWAGLVFNGLWVLGASVILAAFSFSCYEAFLNRERLRARLAAHSFQLWFLAGLALVSLGATLAIARWWERVLWGLLCAGSAWQLRVSWRASKTADH